MSIENNLKEARQKIKAAAERSGRRAETIKIVAASKTVNEDKLREVYQAGLKVFGENKVQEWQQKHLLLPSDCEWHIIGHLQTNKVKYLDERVALIHSLDRFSLLKELNEEGEKRQINWKTLVQVNVARDEAKSGLEIEEIKDFFKSVEDYPRVSIQGLMTIGAFGAEPKETRGYFRKLREIKDSLISRGIYTKDGFLHLSMGMSQDYEMAVEEGATMVRIGSILFGQRN